MTQNTVFFSRESADTLRLSKWSVFSTHFWDSFIVHFLPWPIWASSCKTCTCPLRKRRCPFYLQDLYYCMELCLVSLWEQRDIQDDTELPPLQNPIM